MKKALATLFCAAVAVAANATTQTVNGVSSERASINVAHDNADDIILNSTSGNRYTVGNALTTTYSKVSAINGEDVGSVDIALGTLNIDAQTSTANTTVLSSGNWSMNAFTLNFDNSTASGVALNVNVAKFVLTSGSEEKYPQTQSLYFKNAKYTVTTTATSTIGNNRTYNKSNLYVNSGASVDWYGGMVIGASGTIDISGTFTMKHSNLAAMNFSESGARLFVRSGGKITFADTGNYTLASGASWNFALSSTVTMNAGGSYYLYGDITTATAMDFVKIVSATGTFTQTAGNVAFLRPANFNSGANWTVYDRIVLQGGGTAAAVMATVTVNSGAHFRINGDNGRIVFNANNNLILNQADAFENASGDPVRLATTNSSKNNNLTINSDQTFTTLFVNGGSSALGSGYGDLSVTLGDTGVLRLVENTTNVFNSTNAYLKIFNFREDAVYINRFSDAVADRVGTYVRLYGDETEGSFLGMGILGNDGWVTLTIPEPSTWAALLGFIALGFAAWRRRK